MPDLSRRSRALSVIVAAAVLVVVASLIYLRFGGSTAQPGPRPPAPAIGGPAQFLSARTGWVAVFGGVLATSDGGHHWRRTLTLPQMSVTWIRLFDERHGLVLGSSHRAGAHADRLVRTDDGGAHWTDERLPAVGSMVRTGSLAAFPDRAHGWYVAWETAGSGPRDLNLHRTDDGGTHWAGIEALDFLHSADHGLIRGGRPVGLAFTDAGHGWLIQRPEAVADAVLSMTADGGASWQAVALPAPPGDPRPLSDIGVPTVFRDGSAFLMAVRGFLDVTAYVYRSSDGGGTWGAPVNLTQPAGVIAFADTSHWWRRVGRVAVRTSDGGRTWHRGGQAPDGFSLDWLEPVSDRTAWAIGVRSDLAASELLRTDDGADHWSAVPLDNVS